MKIKNLLSVMLILGFSFVFTNLFATVLVKMNVEDLTYAAGNIVMGVVDEVKCEKDAENGRVYTYNTIIVKQNIKGISDKKVVIRQIGGSYNGMEMWISGTPRFEVGEEVLVFLKKENSRYFLRGMGQGAFSIKEVEGKPMALQKTGNASLYSLNSTGKASVEKAEPKTYELATLLSDINAYMKKEAKIK